MNTKMLIFTAITVLSLKVSARESAHARVCRISGGQQWAVSVQSEFDTLLCLFDEGIIGAAELAQYKWGEGMRTSLKTFLKQKNSMDVNKVCDTFQAIYVTAVDSQGLSWNLCKFADGSVIGANTLAYGADDSRNQGLIEALK